MRRPAAGWERAMGNSAGEVAGDQSPGKDSGFHFKCGGEPLEGSGEGNNTIYKHFQEFILPAVKRVNRRGKRVVTRKPAKRQRRWFVFFHEDHSVLQVGKRLQLVKEGA